MRYVNERGGRTSELFADPELAAGFRFFRDTGVVWAKGIELCEAWLEEIREERQPPQ